ncbi:MAG: pyridoxal phosphate-dependent aminotransferase [Candidatus Zixiibacteriota bacterium]|nr:MAG: pyridoxal phosphate-dependent aminotransferase [candidate division Zixibacteria bacterium]
MLSDRIQRIAFSPTLRISAKAGTMKAEGIDVIDLSVGEPDFPTPDNVKTAGKKAIDQNVTKYTANSGTIALRKAIAKKLKDENNLNYSIDQIIVSSGAKQSIYNACMAILNPGDEVIIPSPYWVSYPEMVNLAGGSPVFIETREENGFRITPDELSAAISPSTKALILNYPCNPSGAAYTREELTELAEVIAEEGMIVISDEIYEKLLYDGLEFISFAAISEKMKAQTVIINGVSKAYSMTGWRLGYAAGPKDIIAAMDKVQSHSTSNASSVSQEAAVEALSGSQHEIARMRDEFQIRRNYMIDRVKNLEGISCYKPRGAFYLFPNVESYFNKEYEGMQIRNSYGLSYYLLKHAHVAVVPGEAFGKEGFIRLSYATSMKNIETAMNRISSALAKLQVTRLEKAISLNNFVTKRKGMVETETAIGSDLRDAIVAEAEAHLSHQGYFEWNANINGIIIQLRTNLSHLYDFWVENWYPGQLESDLEPHGVIYAVGWVPGREPRAYYHGGSRTAVLFKSAYYGQLRSLAIGMADDISSATSDLFSLRGLALDFDGHGAIMIAPKGTGKSKFFAELLRHPRAKIVTDDVLFVRMGADAVADTPERKLYMQTNFVAHYPDLAYLFDKSKCENVITSKEECDNSPCESSKECRLDKGSPFCYEASSVSRVMFDPYWIKGPEKHAKRTRLKWSLILKNDPISPAVSTPSLDEAVIYCEDGLSQTGAMRSTPFFNPHILSDSSEKRESRKRFYRKLFEKAQPYFINIGAAGADEITRRIKSIIGI